MKRLVQQLFQLHQLLLRQANTAPHGLRHQYGLFLQRLPRFRKRQEQLPLVLIQPAPAQQALFFQAFQQRRQRPGIEADNSAQL